MFLVPDDIWLMISLYMSKYIDKNAKSLRKHFVTHEGLKKLTIIQHTNSTEESLKMETEWSYYFKEIIKEIEKNTLEGTMEALSCNFSTTDEIYRVISASIIMSAFKEYFKY